LIAPNGASSTASCRSAVVAAHEWFATLVREGGYFWVADLAARLQSVVPGVKGTVIKDNHLFGEKVECLLLKLGGHSAAPDDRTVLAG
jgi:hypothetical protein